MDLFNLGMLSFNMAQQIAPFDTGNLAFNGISLEFNVNGFTIIYDDNIAPYIVYLEDGTRWYGGAVGFISQDTVYAITKLVYDYFNNNITSETINYDMLTEKAKDTPARQERFLASLGKGAGE